MGAAYNAGVSFADFVKNKAFPVARDATMNALIPAQPIIQGAVPTIGDFLSGAFGGPAPPTNSVTVKLPAARPVAAKAPAVAAPGLGILSPAAAAVLGAAGPAKAPAVAADPLGGLGKLSFRQLLTLSQASENLQPKGSTRTPTSTDQAGAALASIYQQQFKSSIDAAGKDPAKQQAAVDAFEKKMLPIALKGNTADEYLYGSQ